MSDAPFVLLVSLSIGFLGTSRGAPSQIRRAGIRHGTVGGATRRGAMGAAAVAASTLGASSAASAATASKPMVAKVDALVWNAAKGGSNGACSVLDARSAFGPKFVNYLARFLLAYDTPTRRLWRARAAEIPLRWSAKQIAEARREIGRAHV